MSSVKPKSSAAACMIDEKKRRRMLSNRESAKRSRMKREQHVKDLNDQILYFKNKSCEMIQKIDEVKQLFVGIESENRSLRVQREELRKRLEAMERVSSNSMEILQDLLLKPWQASLLFQPMMTSAGNFRF